MVIYDVIVVGSGVAGLYTCLNIHNNLKVLLVTKEKLDKCNSYLAQGGVSVLKDNDDFDNYLEDTLKAGQYKNNRQAVELMIKSSRKVIDDLISYGVDFENEDGKLKYTKEGAHCTERIVYHKDITGKEIVLKLIDVVKLKDNVEIKEDTQMINILKENDRCIGITVKNGEKFKNIYAKKIVLATGGIGGLFKNSTNFSHIKGDGIAIALNNGIETKDLEYVQIHPTALYSKGKGRRFLISESLRGEGAYLLNSKDERFVDELLPRDVVSKAIFDELRKTGDECVYLSFNHKGKEFVKNRFPNIFEKCKEQGYILGEEKIPVTPAQHYYMGGINIDDLGRTSLENLYAVGESACLGIHGANRLASNSLIEALVFSKRAAQDINKNINEDFNVLEKDLVCEDKLDNMDLIESIKKGSNLISDEWFR